MTAPSLPPVLDGEGRPLDTVSLRGLTVRGHHGVFEHERRDGQEFTVDAVLHLDTRPAAAGDDLTRTVHYGELAQALAEAVRRDPVDLVETLAARLAAVCCADERVVAADVSVHKPQAPIPEAFDDVVVTVRRTRAELHPAPGPTGEQDVAVVLALGTNLGDREATLRAAVADLDAVDGLSVTAVSPVVETDPVGGPEQPDYLNAVVLARTRLAPLRLLEACQGVERRHGRTRDVRWGPRTLDVDVITYGELVLHTSALVLPHPRAADRAFVLAPWLAVDPGATLPPTGRPVAALLASAPDRDGVRPRPDLRPLRAAGEADRASAEAAGGTSS